MADTEVLPLLQGRRPGTSLESPSPHVGRAALLLPSQTTELDFSSKVRGQIRRRRQHSRSADQVAATAPPSTAGAVIASPSVAGATAAECAEPSEHPAQSSGSDWPKRVSLSADTRAKYLKTSLILYRNVNLSTPRTPQRSHASSHISSHVSFLKEFAPRSLETARVQICKARTRITIVTNSGEVRVPAHTWLLLDGAGKENSKQIQLLDAAGSGTIQDGAARLRCVSPESLHMRAAEANFLRASRGTSVLALRHAAHVLALLGEEEPQPNPKSARARCNSLPDTASEPTGITTCLTAEVLTRLQRMEGVVEKEAAAAEQRADERKVPKPILVLPPTRDDTTKTSLQRGFLAKIDFLDFAQRRFGNSLRLWFELDREEHMKISEMLFLRRCDEIGFRGSAHALWRYLDLDVKDTFTFEDYDNHAALLLAGFQVVAKEKFGGARRAFLKLDKNKSRRIYQQEFAVGLRSMGWKGPSSKLLDLLDRRGLGFIVESDVTFLEHWSPVPYFTAEPDFEGLERLKTALKSWFGQLVRAWQRLWDRNGKMRVSWDRFVRSCQKMRSIPAMLPKGFLEQQEDVAAIWRALDPDCRGWIFLQAFDPVCHKNLAEFKRWADELYGSVTAAFKIFDLAGKGRMKLAELRKGVEVEPAYTGDLDLVFMSLDRNATGFLSESEVRKFDTWDVKWEEAESAFASTVSHRFL